jgi:hypothetical protein
VTALRELARELVRREPACPMIKYDKDLLQVVDDTDGLLAQLHIY